MEQERGVDKLSRYIIYSVATVLILALCWYFRSVILYIVLAAVVSLLGKPVMNLLRKMNFRGKELPDWLMAVITLCFILSVFLVILTQVIPVVASIVQTITDNYSSSDYSLPVESFMVTVDNINAWLISHFPQFGPDFRIENSVGAFIRRVFDLGSITSAIEYIASFFVSFGVGIFSVVFISFFFVKDPMLFRKIIGAIVPDRIELKVIDAIGDIEHLLSRYFVGLLIEVLGVALLNFLGLWIVAGIGMNAALGIAFITGIMNIIPYVGPLVGTVLGTILSTVLKFSVAGVSGHFWGFIILLVAIFMITQLVDNFLFQPLIYSRSIKSSPLEIFIVLLIAGNLAGVFGMLVAIPAYTVVRVVAGHFFSEVKAIHRLIPDGDAGCVGDSENDFENASVRDSESASGEESKEDLGANPDSGETGLK